MTATLIYRSFRSYKLLYSQVRAYRTAQILRSANALSAETPTAERLAKSTPSDETSTEEPNGGASRSEAGMTRQSRQSTSTEDLSAATDTAKPSSTTLAAKASPTEELSPSKTTPEGKRKPGRPKRTPSADAEEKRKPGRPKRIPAADAEKKPTKTKKIPPADAEKKPTKTKKIPPADVNKRRGKTEENQPSEETQVMTRRSVRKPGDIYWPFAPDPPNPKYPISEQLAKIPRLDSESHVVNIVNPELCDDILSYIGPSLKQYEGFDILDINPGAGVWSSKLHDLLKPRTHVLLEPEAERYSSFLEPLLNKPGSTYKLSTLDPSQYTTYTEIFDQGLLPHQRPTGKNETNRTLLVTGSFAYDREKAGFGHHSVARQLVSKLANTSWSNHLIHRYGAVKMLLWMTRLEGDAFLPKSITTVSKLSQLAEQTHDVHCVATSETKVLSNLRFRAERMPDLEWASAKTVASRMLASGLEIPEHRQLTLHRKALQAVKSGASLGPEDYVIDPDELFGFSMTKDKKEKLDKLESNYQKGKIPKTLDKPSGRVVINPEYQEYMRLKSYDERKYQFRKSLQDVTEAVLKTWEVEKQLTAGGATPERQTEIRGLLQDVELEQNAMLKNLPSMHRADSHIKRDLLADADNGIAFRAEPQRLMWDRREYEPLLARPDDFWPSADMLLLSLDPLPRPQDNMEGYYNDYLMDFLVPLLSVISAPVPRAMESLAPGGSSLIDKAPSIKDIRQGSRLNLEDFRVRMLNRQMIHELLVAFRAWPFKPRGAESTHFFISNLHFEDQMD